MSHYQYPDPDRSQKRTRGEASAAAATKRARREAAPATPPDPDMQPIAAAMPADEEEEEDIPVPMKASAVDWSNFVQDPADPILDPTFCARCRYSTCVAAQVADGNQGWIDLLKYSKVNRNTEHPFSYGRAIQKLWNDSVRHNLTDDKGIPFPDGYDPGPWPAQQIWEHDILHVVDPDAMDLENARTGQQLLRALASNCRYIDRKGNITIDAKNIKEWFDAQKKFKSFTDAVRKQHA